jgi:hypothetical protein
MIPPWLIRARLDHFHPIARGTDHHETKAEEPAQTVRAWISVAASYSSARRLHRPAR